jgi:hypothetical protein
LFPLLHFQLGFKFLINQFSFTGLLLKIKGNKNRVLNSIKKENASREREGGRE